MGRYGYCYDSEGKFTEMIPLEERPIIEEQTRYREEQKEVVTEEKLCEVHQENEDGKFDCPDCVMHKVEFETVQVPYLEKVIVGYEPIVPDNCTLEPVPDGGYHPIFKDGKWVKTAEPPKQPDPVEPEKNEIESLKEQVASLMKVVDELLIGGM